MMARTWKPPSSDFSLSKKDIHIWRVPLDVSPASMQELTQTLSADERQRAERFHFSQDRNRFIVRRGTLRTILGGYLGVKPARLRFCYGEKGKPWLSDTFGNGTIHFSLSHSEGIALYGFTRHGKIGVDIERVRDIPEMDQIAEQFFSVRENAVMRALPESKKSLAFFNCWTRKEAFIKAIGDGLSLSLDRFDVSIVPGEPGRLLSVEGDAEVASRWTVQELEPHSDFVAAFAVEGKSRRLHSWQW